MEEFGGEMMKKLKKEVGKCGSRRERKRRERGRFLKIMRQRERAKALNSICNQLHNVVIDYKCYFSLCMTLHRIW